MDEHVRPEYSGSRTIRVKAFDGSILGSERLTVIKKVSYQFTSILNFLFFNRSQIFIKTYTIIQNKQVWSECHVLNYLLTLLEAYTGIMALGH